MLGRAFLSKKERGGGKGGGWGGGSGGGGSGEGEGRRVFERFRSQII